MLLNIFYAVTRPGENRETHDNRYSGNLPLKTKRDKGLLWIQYVSSFHPSQNLARGAFLAFGRPELQIGILDPCLIIYIQIIFFHFIALYLRIFYENKIILTRSIFLWNSHNKKIICTVPIGSLHVSRSLLGAEIQTHWVRQLPCLPYEV